MAQGLHAAPSGLDLGDIANRTTRLTEGVSNDPASQYHPTIAAEFETVSDEVQRGWRLDEDGTWSAPPAPEPFEPAEPELQRPKVGLVEFKLLFTSAERLKLKELSGTDAALADFFEIIEDSRLQYIDLSLGSTAAGVDHCLSLLINAEIIAESEAATRREQILSGTLL